MGKKKYRFTETFEGNSRQLDFKLSRMPKKKEGDYIDDIMEVTLFIPVKRGITLYENILTFTYPPPKGSRICVKYN